MIRRVPPSADGVKKSRARPAIKPLCLALAMAQPLMSVPGWAQVAAGTPNAPTSADEPPPRLRSGTTPSTDGRSLFESGGMPGIGPRPFNTLAERVNAVVDEIRVRVATDNIPADGTQRTPVRVEFLNRQGLPIDQDIDVTIEVNGGARILLPGRMTSESGADRGDIDRVTPGVQAVARKGELTFDLIAPFQAGDVLLRVSVRGRAQDTVVRYLPELRDMIVVGVLEARARQDQFDPRRILPVRENDAFDREITSFSRDFSGGRGQVGARGALYLKGKVRGDYLLTLRYDSDLPPFTRFMRDIDPNAFYPIYGDSSLRGVDAVSSMRLFVRLDRGRNFFLLGDFTTQDGNPARQLSAYNRALPGVRARYDEGRVTANAFVSEQNFRQIVDEFPARGVSGPYSLSNPNGVAGSERVELLVRDRFNRSLIIKQSQLARGADYEFEPFSGQLLFRAPVPSLDDQLNPVTIRVTYEVSSGGQPFYVAGADLALRVTESLTIGGSIARDQNPANPYQVQGANLRLRLSATTEVLAEVARTTSTINTGNSGSAFNLNTTPGLANRVGPIEGNAARVELRHAGESSRGRAFWSRSDNGFINPSSGFTAGRTDVGIQGAARLSETVNTQGELQKTEDRLNNIDRTTGSVSADLRLSPQLTIGGGVRYANQNTTPAVGVTAASCDTAATATSIGAFNAGFGINQVGNQLINAATGQPIICSPSAITQAATAGTGLSRTAVFGRLSYRPVENLTLGAELQREEGRDNATPVERNTLSGTVSYRPIPTLGLTGQYGREFGSTGGSNLYRVGADWAVAPRTRLYARQEYSRAFTGQYGFGTGTPATTFVAGIDTQYIQDGSLFSEYRIRDGASGKEIQNAIGLRNGWTVAEGLRLVTSAERLNARTSGTGTGATALSLGAEYTGDPLWRGSTRIEWREDANNTNWLWNVSAARRMDQNWTLLARNFFNLIEPRNAVGVRRFNDRLQLGWAFRPVDNNQFDMLGLYELRIQSDPSSFVDRRVNIVSVRANYHPSRPWWISARYAAKNVNEVLGGSANIPGVRSTYTAQLIGGRVTYDITNRWTVGALFNVLRGSAGETQYAYGLEAGYIVMDNLLVSLGYNWRGFNDRDLGLTNYTNRGWVLNLRYKFSEDLFDSNDPRVNRTLPAAADTAISPSATSVTPMPASR